MQPVRVAIIQDEPRVRPGLGGLLEGAPDVRVVGEFPTWESAAREFEGDADVVVAEMHCSGNGVEAVRRLRTRFPDIPILMLPESADADGLYEGIRAGVYGYVLKSSSPERIAQAVHELNEGGAPMSPGIARRVVTMFQSTVPPRHDDHHLSTRELQVLRLLADGHSYKTAAAELGVGVDTARFHIRNIYEKLHVHSKSEAVLTAFRSGLLT